MRHHQGLDCATFFDTELKNVRSDMALNVLAYNIKRMADLIVIRQLIAAFPGLHRCQKPQEPPRLNSRAVGASKMHAT